MNNNYMYEALKQAQLAYKNDEVPVGCVIVKDNKIIARAHNKKEKNNCAVSHAEIEYIKLASKKINNWNLNSCDMYVTLEPCIMCTGAIINSRIRNVYYACEDPKGGALVSSIQIKNIKGLNHYPNVSRGTLNEDCSEILKSFFRAKRKK